MFVIPKTGFVIRDPDLKTILPPEGREVPDTLFWQRRLRDGDVIAGTSFPTKRDFEKTN